MITYDLKCDHGHQFEGWFRSREAFEEQSQKGLVTCPICESAKVSKCLSVPRVNRGEATKAAEQENMAKRVQAMYRYLVENTEDVGRNFAEEVRKIHYNETSYRRIRGIASDEEVEALSEEGIDITPIDWTLLDPETK